MQRVLREDSFLVTFYGWPHGDVFVSTFKDLGFRIVSHLVFVKNVWGLGVFTRGQHEAAFLLAKGKPKLRLPAISDVIQWDRDVKAKHPNQKPLRVMATLVKNFAPAAGVVLDPFMGSGTTGVACVKAGLDFIGCEVDPKHFATAKRRITEANTTLF
jgi:site-specific DNA-methyltransferase (adenine-specific)